MKQFAINASIVVIFGLGIGLALLWLLGGAPPATQAQGPDGYSTYYVATSCAGAPDPCYITVQAAVDAADDQGDVIKVAAGTYTDVQGRPAPAGHIGPSIITQVVYISKTVIIRGGYTTTNWMVSDPDANLTTLDAQGQGRVLLIAGNITPTVEGLRITGGDSAGLRGGRFGSETGGGVYAITATVTISGCRVTGNTAGGIGGGVYLLFGSDTTLTGNAIQANGAYLGGGIYLDSSDSVSLVSNTIQGNIAGGWYYASGGGVYVRDSSTTTLIGNAIQHNWAQNGGGVCLWGSNNVTLSGNTIFSNTATGARVGSQGSAIYLMDSDNAMLSANTIQGNSSEGSVVYLEDSGNATLDNNVITDNQIWMVGGGIHVAGSTARLRHTTLARNGNGMYVTDSWYGGAYVHSTVALTNTVLVSHSVGITVTEGSSATLNGTLWYGNDSNTGGPGTLAVTHQITGNPAFAADGYHITSASAALDAGVDAGVTTDIDGEPRPLGGGYDLGADEIGLFVTKQAYPNPVQPGASLTYTVHITNLFDAVLHATITDTLPLSVTLNEASGGTLALPGGTLAPPDGTVVLPDGRVAVTWTAVITAPGGLWMGTILVTVDEGYVGPLTNLVEVSTEEGATGDDSVTVNAGWTVYLPVVLRNLP